MIAAPLLRPAARLFAVLVLQNCLCAPGATASGQHAAEEPVAVRIALVTTLTGNAAHLGKDEENGARMAIEEINEHGIVIGSRRVKVDLLVEDDGGDPRTATAIAQRVVDEGVVAVVGHMNSGTSIPASHVYAQAGIVQITPSATNPLLTHQGLSTTFRVVATDDAQGPALAEYAFSVLHVRSVAVIDDSSSYGVGLADQFARAARERGIRIVSRDAANDHTVDFRAVLTRIKASRPDAIMFGGMDETGALMVRQAAALSINVPVIGGDGVCGEDFFSLSGPPANRVSCSIAGSATSSTTSGQHFEARYRERFGQSVQGYAPFAYDAVKVISQALQHAGSTTAAAVLQAVRQTDFSGVTGRIRFDNRGDLTDPTISIYGFDSGKRVLKEQIAVGSSH